MKVKLQALLAVLLIALASCTPTVYTKLDMTKALLLTPEMSKTEVIETMGQPVLSDFSQGVEEWHYCNTGKRGDEYVALWFHDGKLVEKLNYTVTATSGGGYGDCKMFVKRGTYVVPDVVITLREGY